MSRPAASSREAIRASFVIVTAEDAGVIFSLHDNELLAFCPNSLPSESWRSFEHAINANWSGIVAVIAARESAP